jgi:hypothetical protein
MNEGQFMGHRLVGLMILEKKTKTGRAYERAIKMHV